MEEDLGCGNKKKLWYFEADGEVYLHESTPDEEDFKVHKPTQSIDKLEEKKSTVEKVSENLDVTIYRNNTSSDKFLKPTSNENLDVTIYGDNTSSDKFLEPTSNENLDVTIYGNNTSSDKFLAPTSNENLDVTIYGNNTSSDKFLKPTSNENLDVTIYGNNTSSDKFLKPISNENLDVTIYGDNTSSDKFLEPTSNENLDVTIYGNNTSSDKFLKPTSNENLDVTIYRNNTSSDKFLKPTSNGIISMISIISYLGLYMQRLFTTLSTSCKGIKIVEFLVTALLLLSPMVASQEGQVNSTLEISVVGPVMVGKDVSLYCKCNGDCIGNKRWTGGQDNTELINNNHVIQDGIVLLENSEDRYFMKISNSTGKYIDFKLTCFFGLVFKYIILDVHKVSSKPPPTQSTVTSTSSSEQPKKGGLSDGTIAGIVVVAVGVVAAIAVAVVCIIFQCCNCRSPYKEEVAQVDNVYEL